METATTTSSTTFSHLTTSSSYGPWCNAVPIPQYVYDAVEYLQEKGLCLLVYVITCLCVYVSGDPPMLNLNIFTLPCYTHIHTQNMQHIQAPITYTLHTHYTTIKQHKCTMHSLSIVQIGGFPGSDGGEQTPPPSSPWTQLSTQSNYHFIDNANKVLEKCVTPGSTYNTCDPTQIPPHKH